MEEQRKRLQFLVEKLTELGDDAAELQMWNKIFDDLEEVQQQEILTILEDEYKKLSEISKK